MRVDHSICSQLKSHRPRTPGKEFTTIYIRHAHADSSRGLGPVDDDHGLQLRSGSRAVARMGRESAKGCEGPALRERHLGSSRPHRSLCHALFGSHQDGSATWIMRLPTLVPLSTPMRPSGVFSSPSRMSSVTAREPSSSQPSSASSASSLRSAKSV